MRFILLAAAGYTAFSLQSTLAPRLQIGPARFDLAIAGLFWILGRAAPAERLWLAAAWGLVADALGDGPLGLHVVWHTMLACGAEACGGRRGWSAWLALGLCAFVGIASGRLVLDAFDVGLAGAHTNWQARLWVALATAFCTTLVAVPGHVMAGNGVSRGRANAQSALHGGFPISIS
jgi:hypothetical protein